MPGMLETVLDVGLTPQTVEGLIRLTGNPRLAWDSFRRLVQGYAEVVAGLPTAPFDALLREALAAEQEDNAQQLDHRALRRLTLAMLERYRTLANADFPADPLDQLSAAAGAVFRSWDAPKAATYRRLNGLDDAAGTAVTVQTMVFGNAGGASGAGVGFTRDPASGEPRAVSRLLLQRPGRGRGGRPPVARRQRPAAPRAAGGARAAGNRSRRAGSLFADAQDFEFTVQDKYCICCKHAPPSARHGPACASPSTWSRKA